MRTYNETVLRGFVKAGGGIYVGIQDCEPLTYDLVLFNSPNTGSTLALKPNDVTTAAVRAKIEASDREFSKRRKQR